MSLELVSLAALLVVGVSAMLVGGVGLFRELRRRSAPARKSSGTHTEGM